ncbi:MAG TPA: hypothetical protein VME46_24275 [Acidimicrobiales bacterium]|nr:hypothetical protein [Acidimicrobiales bacterium]
MATVSTPLEYVSRLTALPHDANDGYGAVETAAGTAGQALAAPAVAEAVPVPPGAVPAKLNADRAAAASIFELCMAPPATGPGTSTWASNVLRAQNACFGAYSTRASGTRLEVPGAAVARRQLRGGQSDI